MLIPFTGGFAHGQVLHLGILFVPGSVLYRAGHGQRRQFHRRPGRPVHQRNESGGDLPDSWPSAKHGISPVTGAVVGNLLGFLLLNVYPAGVMGDTGSLALGFVGERVYDAHALASSDHRLTYFVGGAVVIIQVTYF